MGMVKVFLVEDEVIIRNGIKKSIAWEKEGYEFVGEASDGELALPLILKEKPDILITDIKMPFMDGLELSRLVRQELPDTKILILSGYDEFDYAKEAIRLSVTEYLVKPISAVKLLEALNQIRERIWQEEEEKKEREQYLNDRKENQERIKERFFQKLVSGEMHTAEAIAFGKEHKMNLSASVYTVVLFKILQMPKSDNWENGLGEVYGKIEELVAKIPYIYNFQRGVDGWAFLVTADNEDEMGDKIVRFVEKLRNFMREYPKAEYFGAVGHSVRRIREVRQSFCDADRLFASRFTQEPNQILSAGEMHREQEADALDVQQFVGIERSRNLIERFLNNGTIEEIESFTEAYIEEMAQNGLKSVIMRQYIIMDIYIIIRSFGEKMEISDREYLNDVEELQKVMQKSHSLREIQNYLVVLLRKTINIRDTISGKRYSDVISAAQEIIRKTYMSEDISLNTVAVNVGMSPSYFSSIFSREVGKTFVEYLTEVRIEKAKELLMCSSMKTSEVGYEVGYKDPHYFSYIFKKKQGCSPKEYRARKKELR